MPAEITMPQLSDTMTEGTVVKWLKKEGEKVKAGEKLADIETDKAVMEMEAFEGGTLAAILVREGEKVPVGTLLGMVATAGDDAAQVKQSAAKIAATKSLNAARPADSQQAGASTAGASAAGAKTGGARPTGAQSPIDPHAGGGSFSGATATIEQASSGEMHEPDEVIGHGATREPAVAFPPIQHDGNGAARIFISPLARRVAKQANIDIGTLRGTGPGGRITRDDVILAQSAGRNGRADSGSAKGQATGAGGAKRAVPVAPQPRIPAGQTQIVPMSKMRLAIAKNLVASKQNIPHFYTTIDADIEDLSALRVRLNQSLESEKIRLSIGDFIAKAVAVALGQHPAINSTFNGTEITRYGDVHLGMAVAIPDGLIVPVLRNVNLLGVKDIRQRSADLVDRARAQRLKQEEMSGGTFTVTNLGTYGVREFSAIINPPQVAILAIAAAEKRAVVRDDQIVARTMLTLTLSADHRVVDGAMAADFLRTLKILLEDPGLMLV